MILLVDFGNTNIKWSPWDGRGGLGTVCRERHREKRLADILNQHWKGMEVPESVHVACVAGNERLRALRRWVSRHWPEVPVVVHRTQAQQCGIRNGYEVPEQLGVDRWLTLIGARSRRRRAVCVIDVGTAMTVDFVNGGGRHQGGLIMPGLELMRDALLQRTAEVTLEQGAQPRALAASTGDAVLSGTLYMLVATIERLLEEPLLKRAQVILTGGDAEQLKGLLGNRVDYRENLVLQGLARVLRETG